MSVLPNPLALFGLEGCTKNTPLEGVFPENWTMVGHQRGLLVVTFFQGSLGLTRMCLGDVFGGAYALLLATLG